MRPSMPIVAQAGAACPRHWMDREAGQCAWPIGEGTEVLSCCAPIHRLPGGRATAYCEGHWTAMWRPAPDAAVAGERTR